MIDYRAIVRDFIGILNNHLNETSSTADRPVITESTDLTKDLCFDSVEMVDLICAAEDCFEIIVPVKALPKFHTVADVARAIQALKEGSQSKAAVS